MSIRRCRLPLWLALLVLIAPLTVRAAEFLRIEDGCNGRQLMIKGPIERGDYDRFVQRLARMVTGDLPDVQNPDVLWTVKLDSPGGDLQDAMRIGRLLRRSFATTEVSYRYAPRPDGVVDFQRSDERVCLTGHGKMSGCHRDIVKAECTGACLLVWLGGTERHAIEGRLGLHGLPGGDVKAVRDYLKEMDVPGPWTQRIVATQAVGDVWLTWPERHALEGRSPSLQALTADCPAPLSRHESYLSVVSPDDVVRNRLKDRAAATRDCRRRYLAQARASTVNWLASQLTDARATQVGSVAGSTGGGVGASP